MAVFTSFTRGGQVHLHQLRMLKQVLITGLLFSILIGIGYFGYQLFMKIPSYAWRITYEKNVAELILSTLPPDKQKEATQNYVPLRGKPYRRNCLHILKDPYIKKTTTIVETWVSHYAYKSLWFSFWTFLFICGGWLLLGYSHRRSKHHRGTTLVSWRSLKRKLKWMFKASDLKFGSLPLVRDKETSHTLITGTTGSGKTNAFNILLPQIRRRGDRAIIVDVTGDYVSRYYDEKRDIILNPLDVRSQAWSPWADCELDAHYDVFAESLIAPKEGRTDPFWDNASRALLKTALRKYAHLGNSNIEALYEFLMTVSEREFDAFFKGTEAATFASKDNEKTTQSIRSSLSSQIECLRHLENSTSPFSIRQWVRSELKQGWLFLTARADQRQTLSPLLSAWVDMAINALMILPEDRKRRLWFVIDELAALQKLPRLQAGLAEARKYGGCIFAGFQSKPQLEDIYGRDQSEAMLDLFNTKIFFRSTEPNTQGWISKVLGEKEEEEATENISYGANTIRDGVSLGRQTRTKPLIMPTELSQLKDLECYIKLPGSYPITRLQTKYQAFGGNKVEPFILKSEKPRFYISKEDSILDSKGVVTNESSLSSQEATLPSEA